jgi:hypothetical protein
MTKSIRALIPYTIAVYLALMICLVADARNSQDKYSTYINVRFSYSISYPTSLLIPQGEADNGDGQKFRFRDGKATMSVSGIHALDETLLHRYNEQLQEGRGDNRSTPTFTYKVLRPNWFVVSGRDGDRIFYQKTILRKGVFKTFRIEYDKALSDVFDEVTKRVAASFRG